MSREAQSKPQRRDNAFENKKLSPEKAREIRAFGILGKGDLPLIVDEENFFVPSQSDKNKKYKVTHISGQTGISGIAYSKNPTKKANKSL